MAMIITMPRLSPTMEEGVLAKWTKREGDKIAPGDIIAEVETDKANMDFPLEDEGVLLKQLAKEGETVRLGAPVAILGEQGEDISAVLAEAAGQGGQAQQKPAAPKPEQQKPAEAKQQPEQPQQEPAEPKQQPEQAEAPAQQEPAQQAAPPEEQPAAAQQEPAAAAQGAGGRTVASPLARRLATDAGIDIRQLKGSGPGGRVIKRDIERAVAEPKPAPAVAKAPAPAPAAAQQQAPAGSELVPWSMMRKTIARRLTESKQTVPHFYLTAEAVVDDLMDFREDVNRAAAQQGTKVSVNDLVVKAMARALRQWPQANASYTPEGALRHKSVDIGVAVALEDGLITPVVRAADQKSVGALSGEIRDLAERGKQKKLRPDEYQGGTFSVSNLGMFGIREFFAIVNPPESGILAVGKVEKRPAVIEDGGQDHVVSQRRMTLTLSCDHRIIDGALGAKLLAEVVRALEQPLLLVL